MGGRSVALAPGEIEARFEIGIDQVLAAEFAVLDFTETAHEYAYRLHAADAWLPLGRRRQLRIRIRIRIMIRIRVGRGLQ